MSPSTSTFRRLGAVFALTAAVAAITAPTTLANHQDVGVEAALVEIHGTAGAPDAVDRYLRNHPQAAADVKCDVICRDLHNQERGITLSTDTLGGDGGAPWPATAPSNRSSWPAGALAAVTASGTIVVLLAGTLLVLRRRRSIAA